MAVFHNIEKLCVWGYLKSNVNKGKPRTLEELRAAIQNQIEQVSEHYTCFENG